MRDLSRRALLGAAGVSALAAAGCGAVSRSFTAPAPASTTPGHGRWITHATDRAELTICVLVLPTDPTSGPIARIHLPQRVPLELHGSWLLGEIRA